MIYCFNAEVAFTSANRRNQVMNAMDANRQTKLVFGISQLDATLNKIGSFGIYAILRFPSLADRDDFVTQMLAFAVGQFAPIAGSWYRLHNCLHDENGACDAGTITVF